MHNHSELIQVIIILECFYTSSRITDKTYSLGKSVQLQILIQVFVLTK